MSLKRAPLGFSRKLRFEIAITVKGVLYNVIHWSMTNYGVFRVIRALQANLHDHPRRIAPARPGGHGIVRGAQARFVPERPRDDTGVVLIPLHHALRVTHTCTRKAQAKGNREKDGTCVSKTCLDLSRVVYLLIERQNTTTKMEHNFGMLRSQVTTCVTWYIEERGLLMI